MGTNTTPGPATTGTTTRTTPREIALLRLAAQRLAGAGAARPVDTVRWLAAMQAQDPAGVQTSVALRTACGTRAAVEAAFDAGEIVTSWPMRGTLHLVAAEDLPWMLGLMAPRVVAGTAARRAQLGLDERQIDRARTIARAELEGGRGLPRADLIARWDEGGLTAAGPRGYHLLGHLAQTGELCFGPTRDGDRLVVLVEEWIPRPRRLDRDESLGELATRYFRSHGPATVADFTRWTKLVAADVRMGLALARPVLASVAVDGIEHLMDPGTPDRLAACRRQARGVFLLPGFDEFMLGYGDRRAALPAEFADLIVPGGNGVFRPTVVSGGQVVGTWRHAGRGTKRSLAATPFQSFTTSVQRALPRRYAALP